MPTITTPGALAEVTYDSTNNVLRLIPLNSIAKTVLDAAYTDASALTTVALAQEDAGRGGYGDTSQPYKVLKLTLS